MAGYSGTLLTVKLGLKADALLYVVNAPAGYRKLLALPRGYVDMKVCVVSEIWSGLKLVVRKE